MNIIDLVNSRRAKKLKKQLDDGSDPNFSISGITALMYAVKKKNNMEVIKILLNANADPNLKNSFGITALMFVSDLPEKIEVVKLLLDAGANINEGSNDAMTPLMYALSVPNNFEMVKLLLDKGANVNANNRGGGTPLLFALEIPNNVKIVELLLNSHADPNFKNPDLDTPLILAAKYDEVLSLKLLLEAGADPNLTDFKGETALSYAIMNLNEASIQLLINYGANINEKTSKSSSIIKKLLIGPNYSRQLKILSGPNFFAFFKSIDGRKILLLGESHNVENICQYGDINLPKHNYIYEVQNWFSDLAMITNQCFDLFVEDQYHTNPDNNSIIQNNYQRLSNYHSPLTAVVIRFANHRTEFTKIRYHYIDVRTYYDIDNNFSSPFDDLFFNNDDSDSNYCLFDQTESIDEKHDEYKQHIISYISGFDRSKKAQKHFENYLSDLFEMIGKNYDPKNYEKYMEHYFKLIDKEISKIDKKYTRQAFYKNLLDIYYEFSEGILCDFVFIIPMDIYFLSRSLIQFDQKKINRGPNNCSGQQIKNIIFYGGAYHANIYMKFYEKFFNQEPTIYIDNIDPFEQCIVFDQPFDFLA